MHSLKNTWTDYPLSGQYIVQIVLELYKPENNSELDGNRSILS